MDRQMEVGKHLEQRGSSGDSKRKGKGMRVDSLKGGGRLNRRVCFIEVQQQEVGRRGRWRMCRWKGEQGPRSAMEEKDVMEKWEKNK